MVNGCELAAAISRRGRRLRQILERFLRLSPQAAGSWLHALQPYDRFAAKAHRATISQRASIRLIKGIASIAPIPGEVIDCGCCSAVYSKIS